jgi:hypothetical protein
LRLALAAPPGSAHFAQCLRYHLHPSADLVLLEFSVNDGHGNLGSTANVERIVRRILHTRGGMDASPALLIVNWWDHWAGCTDNTAKAKDRASHTRGGRKSSAQTPPADRNICFFARNAAKWQPMWERSSEAAFAAVAQYYDLSSVSLRDALMLEVRPSCGWMLARRLPLTCVCAALRRAGHARRGWLFVCEFQRQLEPPKVRAHARTKPDGIADSPCLTTHVSASVCRLRSPRGHRMMADASIHLIARIANEAAAARASAAADAPPAPLPPPPPRLPGDAPLWLPPPLVEGNDVEAAEPICHYGEQLHQLLISAQGWEFLPDIEKPGFVTNVSGSVLELAAGVTDDTTISLSYLHGYLPGMGGATITCHDSCTCAPQPLDGRRPSGGGNVMIQHHFGVSAAPNCTLRVTSDAKPPLSGDGPEGMRFKVMGLTVGGKKASGGLGQVVRACCGRDACIVRFMACGGA